MRRYTVTVLTEDLNTRERSYEAWTVIAESGRAASNDATNALSYDRDPQFRRTVQGVKEWRG